MMKVLSIFMAEYVYFFIYWKCGTGNLCDSQRTLYDIYIRDALCDLLPFV